MGTGGALINLKKEKINDFILVNGDTIFDININNLVKICKSKISENQNELSENKICSWTEVECLGACVNGPMMQINQDYFEDLNENKMEEIIQNLLSDKFTKPGSAKNRKNTAPENGKTSLIEVKNA